MLGWVFRSSNHFPSYLSWTLFSSYPGRIKSLKAGDSGRRQIPPGLKDDTPTDDVPLEALARRGSNTSQKSVQSVQSLGGMDSLNSSTSGTLRARAFSAAHFHR